MVVDPFRSFGMQDVTAAVFFSVTSSVGLSGMPSQCTTWRRATTECMSRGAP